MITFKQYLDEKRMTDKEFEKAGARQGSAKLGFEYEMVVPRDSPMFAVEEDNREYTSLNRVDSLPWLLDYFQGHAMDEKLLEADFEKWQDIIRQEWVADNTEDGDDTDQLEREFEKRHAFKLASFGEFVESQYRSLYKLIGSYELRPRHGWESDSGNDSSRFYTEDTSDDEGDNVMNSVFGRITDSLGATLGVDFGDSSDGWQVSKDGSIDGGVGAEVISPPEPLGVALKHMDEVFSWMTKHKIETNTSTGLHINLSLADMGKVDLLKLVLFMGDKHVLKQFDRLGNMYTRAQTANIVDELSHKGELPKEASAMIKIARDSLSNAKYSSVHITKMSSGYLEFRIAGNTDYHRKPDLVRSTVLRFVHALEIAADPNAERKEYLKKVSKILNVGAKAGEIHDYDERSIANVIATGGFESAASNLKQWLESAKNPDETFKDNIADLVSGKLIPDLLSAMYELGIKEPSSKQRAEMKLILKRLGVSKDDITPFRALTKQKYDLFKKLFAI